MLKIMTFSLNICPSTPLASMGLNIFYLYITGITRVVIKTSQNKNNVLKVKGQLDK
jgi:hypothetical protein